MTRQELVAELERCLARRRQLEWQLFVMALDWQRAQLVGELAQVKLQHGRLEARLKKLERPPALSPVPPSRPRRSIRPTRLIIFGLTLGLVFGWSALAEGFSSL